MSAGKAEAFQSGALSVPDFKAFRDWESNPGSFGLFLDIFSHFTAQLQAAPLVCQLMRGKNDSQGQTL